MRGDAPRRPIDEGLLMIAVPGLDGEVQMYASQDVRKERE